MQVIGPLRALAIAAAIATAVVPTIASAETRTCLGANEPSVFGPCVRTALGEHDPDVRADALRAYFARQSAIVIGFTPPPIIEGTRNRMRDGKVTEGELSGNLRMILRFDEGMRGQVALRLSGLDANGAIQLVVVDALFKETKNQNDLAQMSRGVGQVSGKRFRASFRYAADGIQGVPQQCTFDGELTSNGDRLVGSFSCTGFLPKVVALINLL